MKNKEIQFTDYLKIDSSKWKKEDINKIADSILSSIEKQKDSRNENEIEGLKISSIDAHAGKMTRHNHLYIPKDMKKAALTLTHPYNIPVLSHHDSYKDAIGRVEKSKYVSVNPSLERILDSLDFSKESHRKKMWKLVSQISQRTFEGAGRLEDVSNIVDEDAITKILDKRYDTISMGYRADKVICSECGEDIRKCEHFPGQDYGHGPVFLIFDGLEYLEKSYVNEPADLLAGNSFYAKLYEKDNANSKSSKDELCIGSCTIDFSDNINTTNDEAKMEYAKLIKMGEDLYSKVLENLPENSEMTLDTIKELKDNDFVGSNRLLPAVNKELVEASIKIVDELEDSEEKTELLDFLKIRLDSFTAQDSEEESEEQEEKENSEEEDSNSSKTTDEAVEFGKDSVKFTKGEMSTDEFKEVVKNYVTVDSFLDFISDNEDAKKDLFEKVAGDKVSVLESRIDSFKHELEVQKTNFEAISETAKKLAGELKDFYVEKLLQFRSKEDPAIDSDSIKERLSKRSLDYLKDAYEDFLAISSTEEITEDEKIDTDSSEFEENSEVTEQEISVMEDRYFKNYKELLMVNRARAAEYLKDYTQKLAELKSKLNKNK